MKKVISASIILLFFTNCKNEDPKNLKLNGDERYYVDTTAARKIGEIMPRLDSLCKDSADALVQRIVDSLLPIRQLELQQEIQKAQMPQMLPPPQQ